MEPFTGCSYSHVLHFIHWCTPWYIHVVQHSSSADIDNGLRLQAVEHWEAALKISPLHPAGWFALGFGALKLKDFTRAVRVSKPPEQS